MTSLRQQQGHKLDRPSISTRLTCSLRWNPHTPRSWKARSLSDRRRVRGTSHHFLYKKASRRLLITSRVTITTRLIRRRMSRCALALAALAKERSHKSRSRMASHLYRANTWDTLSHRRLIHSPSRQQWVSPGQPSPILSSSQTRVCTRIGKPILVPKWVLKIIWQLWLL